MAADAQSAVSTSTRAEIVARFNRIHGEIQVFKPQIAQMEADRLTILGWYPDLQRHESKEVVEGEESCLITVADNQRVVTIEGKRKLIKLWKLKKFLAHCTLALKHLPDKDDPGNLYTMQDRTGPRHIKPLPRLTIKPAA